MRYGGVQRFDRRTSFSQNVTPWPLGGFELPINKRRYRDPWTPVLVFSPADKTSLYLGTQYVMKTIDGGLHWQEISPDLTGAVSTSRATKTHYRRKRSATRLRGRVYHCAITAARGADLGGIGYGTHPPDDGQRQDLARCYAARAFSLEQDFSD